MRWRILIAALLAVGCGVHAPAVAPRGWPPQVPLATTADKRAAFARAYELFRHGEEAQALPIFLALADRYPELADYALYFAGTIALRSSDDAAAEDAFTRLLRDYPQSVKAREAALQAGTLRLRADRVDQARPLLQDALLAPDSATGQGARLALAEADEHSGDLAAAYAGYTEVRRAMTGSALGRTAKQRQLALRADHPELVPQGSDLLDEARLLLAEHDYAAAQRAAQQLLQLQDGVEPADAVRIQADALYGRGEVESALAKLRELVDRYPESAAAPAALFRLASVLWNRDRDDTALGAFDEFRRRYADDPRVPEALYAIGRIHQSAARTDLAISAFAALARRYPRSTATDDARWQIGWIQYRSRNWVAAAAAFSRLGGESASPRQRTEALYWQARSLERGEHVAEARSLYREIIDHDPTDYYATWAERRLGVATDTLLPTRVEPRLTHAAEDAAVFQPPPSVEAFHFGRWGELKAAGVYPLARAELGAVERERGDDLETMRYLLRAYPSVDGFAAAQRLLRRLGESAGLSEPQRQHLLYPLAFWNIVSGEARDNSVDPLLIEAIMRQESLFDPEAKSSANAYGLMQLLPDTAARLASTNGRAVDPLALFQPDLNINLGTHYLDALLARFGGDVLKAVAAYNGGEAAVEKWQQRFGGLEEDEFVESISYRETRDYVKRVMTNYRTYRQLYAEQGS